MSGAPGTTPGPWKVGHIGASHLWVGPGHDEQPVALVPWDMFGARDNARVNAHQIAASGALYDAVMAASALAVCCMAPGCYSQEELSEMARATKPTFDAALALARGEQPA